jgi:hypothetical protein
MNELRNLLLDCRSALRRADAAFDGGALRPRLDQTIIAMSTEDARRHDGSAQPPLTFAAQQVAYAWQQAARELHFTHPSMYAELGERVRERLQSDTPVDTATELLQTQSRLRDMMATHDALQSELSGLHATLAAAVALEGNDARGTAAERAQRQLQVLIQAAHQGSGVPRPRQRERGAIAPTTAELQDVAEGTRAFTSVEREWCIGEAVVRTQFEKTPERLLADGDRALALLLLQEA